MSGHGWERLDASDEQSVSQSAVSAQPVTHMLLACDHIHRRTCPSPSKDRQRGSQAGRQAYSESLQYVAMTARSTPHCKRRRCERGERHGWTHTHIHTHTHNHTDRLIRTHNVVKQEMGDQPPHASKHVLSIQADRSMAVDRAV